MEQTTFLLPELPKEKRTRISTEYFYPDLAIIKNFPSKIITNVAQTSYADVRNMRKKVSCVNKERFTAKDREDYKKIKKLLQKVYETHPELCSKEIFIKTELAKRRNVNKR